MGTLQINAQDMPVNVYLIPGQGSDYRLFNNLELYRHFQKKHIHYSLPNDNQNMAAYARQLAQQIDTTKPFYIIGVSLGGMLATEMADFLKPEKTIIISSAKSKHELPDRYTKQKYFPVYQIVSPFFYKKGALFMQPIVEPDRNLEKATFKAMLKDKNPLFLKRSVKMIIEWERQDYQNNIIHIHGNNDRTIPVRNVYCQYVIDNGSHMMILTRGKELSKLINKILLKDTDSKKL